MPYHLRVTALVRNFFSYGFPTKLHGRPYGSYDEEIYSVNSVILLLDSGGPGYQYCI